MQAAMYKKTEREKGMEINNNAVELKEMVYAPLQALSDANIKLSSNIVDFISSASELSDDESGNYTAHLNTIQMQYKQLRNDADDNTVADLIGLEVPLLSICHLSTLKVSKSKVSFSLEVKELKNSGEAVKIYTQVSSGQQRESANIPRLNYEIELESAPVSEGLARFLDVLNANATPKHIRTDPLDDSGNTLKGEDLGFYKKRMEFMEREAELKEKLREIRRVIRSKNKLLSTKTGMDYDEYLESPDFNMKDEEISELCTSIREYREIRSSLEDQLDSIEKEKVEHFLNGNETEDNNA
jgi:hypothetical protein